MSISKLKAMTETLEKMEEMQKQVNEDVGKDITAKRKEALQKIRNYLDEVADSLNGKTICVSLDYELFCCNIPTINFNREYKIKNGGISTYPKYSDEKVKWWIGDSKSTKISDDEYWQYIDSTNNISRKGRKEWAEGFIQLIENWDTIKVNIESNLEKELMRQMEKIRKDTSSRIESYEKVTDFEA